MLKHNNRLEYPLISQLNVNELLYAFGEILHNYAIASRQNSLAKKL